MAKLMLAFSTFLFFCFLSLSYALTSSNFPKAPDIAPHDIPYDKDNLMAFDLTELKEKSDDSLAAKSESIEILIPIDLTEEKKETSDIFGSASSRAFPFYHIHHHHNHQLKRSGHKEILYGNDMILSPHGNFENMAYKEVKGFNKDSDLRKFHHHFDEEEVKGREETREEHPRSYWFHQRKFGGVVEQPYYQKEIGDIPGSAPSEAIPFYYNHHHHNHQPKRLGHKEIPYGNDMILSPHGNFENLAFKEAEGLNEDSDLRKFHHHFDEGEVKGMEETREERPRCYWFHQRKFRGEVEHPYYQKSHSRHHHHHNYFEEEEKHEEGGLLFKLRKFLDWF